MFKSSDRRKPSAENDVVVEIRTAGVMTGPGEQSANGSRPGDQPVNGFKRKLERARGLLEEQEFVDSVDDKDDLKLQVMLLREENTRLKAARYKPADPGSVIEQVRVLADSDGMGDLLDETWDVLAECLALREGLDRACEEIENAISSVRERLRRLGAKIDTISPSDAGAQDASQTSLSA